MQKLMKNKKIVIPVGIVIVLLIVYLLICAFVQSKDFLTNTTINGIKVGGMTKEEAVIAVQEQFQNDSQSLNLTLLADDKKYKINVKDNISFDSHTAVEKIYDEVNGSFLAHGYNFLFHSQFNAPITIKNEDQLLDAVKKSKILEYDTKGKTQYKIGEKSVIFTKGHDGEKTDQEDILSKIHAALENYEFKDEIKCSLVDSKNDDEEMKNLHEKLSKGAKNATLDKNNDYAIVDAQVGVEYDLDESINAFHKASDGETFEVSANIIQPKVTKEMLEKNLFKDVMGSYTTYVSGTSVRRNNVKLAGSKCDGTILLPGEEFSYNGTVGQRTKANGFGEAGAYLNGETVQEVGGGVCQPSSTLYNAVVLANLKITERHNHTYVSGYVPLGRDATVSWGGPDFKFKNDTDYPIKVTSSYSNNRLTMQIIGTDLENTKVEFVSETLSRTPYKTIEKEDKTMEEGKRKVDVTGYSGAKAQTYRKVYKNGKLVSSEKEAYSVYSRRDKVVIVGTKKKEEAKPATPNDSNKTQPSKPQTNTTSQTNTTQSEDKNQQQNQPQNTTDKQDTTNTTQKTN